MLTYYYLSRLIIGVIDEAISRTPHAKISKRISNSISDFMRVGTRSGVPDFAVPDLGNIFLNAPGARIARFPENELRWYVGVPKESC